MTNAPQNLNIQAYRADGGDIGTDRIKEIANNPYGDEEKCWLAKRVLASLCPEPVAWTDADELREVRNGGNGYLFAIDGEANKFADPHRQVRLYTSPPAPVVAELCAAIESLLDMQVRMVKQTNVGASFFDGETISAMNYAPIQAKQALELAEPYK